MARQSETQHRDVAECKARIRALLSEYNCELISADEYHDVLIFNPDTDEWANMNER